MRNTSLLLCLVFCIFTSQQALALRRIKRGSTATQNKTKLSSDILLDQRSISNDIQIASHGKHTVTATDNHEEAKGHAEHGWAKKAVAAVEHVIDKAFSSLSHKSEVDKSKKSAQQLANTGMTSKLAQDSGAANRGLHQPSLAYLLNNGGFEERFSDDMQHGGAFGAGEGAAEVLIIDNGPQPVTHGARTFTFHQPNLQSFANSFKRFSEISKESKLNNHKALKINTDNSNNNALNNNVVGKLSNDNRISVGNANEDAMLKHSKRNDKQKVIGDNKSAVAGMDDAHKRNNDHDAACSGNNGETKYNSASNNENNIVDISHTINEQQPEEKESLPIILSQSHKLVAGVGEPEQIYEKADGERAKKADQKHPHQLAKAAADLNQQALQTVKHANGKMLPMESFLKFANMMLYKVRPDGVPIHAQGAQISVNGNPTTSVIRFGPSVDAAEDADTINFLYNSIDPQISLLHNSAGAAPNLISPSSSALLSRSFLFPPFSLAGPAQPLNFMENALDLFLTAEDEGNDELEMVCPIHHPKKKSSESSGDGGKDKDGVIQVCSCRFFKKSKNA